MPNSNFPRRTFIKAVAAGVGIAAVSIIGIGYVGSNNSPKPIGGPSPDPRFGVYFEYDEATKRIAYAYGSGDYAYKVTVGPNGHNQLPNIISIHRATLDGELSSAKWSLLSQTRTDYFPPMVFRSVTNGDDSRTFYTGGAHGADGGGGGGKTARNTLWNVYIDGKLVDATSSGYAHSISGKIVNELFAYNTVGLGRYALRQVFDLNMSGSGMEVHADITALEDVQILIDNGPQAYFGGFNDTQLISDSAVIGRNRLDPSVVSGPRSEYPGSWLLLMKSGNGTMACWVDREYEAGDGRYVAPAAPFIRGGGKGRAKFYNAIVARSRADLSAGSGYRWRGGYHFFADTRDEQLDTKVVLTIGQKRRTVVVAAGGESQVLRR